MTRVPVHTRASGPWAAAKARGGRQDDFHSNTLARSHRPGVPRGLWTLFHQSPGVSPRFGVALQANVRAAGWRSCGTDRPGGGGEARTSRGTPFATEATAGTDARRVAAV